MNLHLRTRVPALAQALADEEPSVVAHGIGQGRIAIGVAMVLAPRTFTRQFLRADEPAPDALTAWRMAGVRDIALGLGTVMAVRKASPSLRGWVEAGALADAGDVYAFSRDGAFYPILRAGAALAAGVAAGVGIWTARRLGSRDPQ